MGKVRKEGKKGKSGASGKGSGTTTYNPGAAQGLVFNTSGYGQHILKNPQVVQVFLLVANSLLNSLNYGTKFIILKCN